MIIKAYKLNFLLLTFLLVVCSCNSEKQPNETKVNTAQKDLTSLEISLPFESSNYVSEDEIKFELLNLRGEKLKPEFDTVTKTGGLIIYRLENGRYKYSIKTPFNEIIKRDIIIKKDTNLNFYGSCYDKVQELSLNDLKYSQKINISVTYEFNEYSKDEIEISKKENQYFLSLNNNNNRSEKISIDSILAINALNKFENSIARMYRNKVIGTQEYSYMNASQVFIKYDNKLFEVHNINHDSLKSAMDELKRDINKNL